MDPASPSWRAHLIDQARRHLEKVPDSDGLAIDRMWWSYPTVTRLQRVNYGADDGVGWYGGRPGRHFCISVRSILDDLGAVDARHAARSSSTTHSRPIGWTATRTLTGSLTKTGIKPAAGLRARGQRPAGAAKTGDHLDLLGRRGAERRRLFSTGICCWACIRWCRFPPTTIRSARTTRPSTRRTSTTDRCWLAMRGKKWVLAPHCIEVEGAKAKANLFEVPAGWVAPVVFGPNEATVKVLVRNVAGISDARKIEVLQPGVERPQPVTAVLKDGVLALQVPLNAAAAMLRWER